VTDGDAVTTDNVGVGSAQAQSQPTSAAATVEVVSVTPPKSAPDRRRERANDQPKGVPEEKRTCTTCSTSSAQPRERDVKLSAGHCVVQGRNVRPASVLVGKRELSGLSLGSCGLIL
jgi:hypothetical protein